MAGESSVFQSDEALKAMAVAARTYAIRLRGRHSSENYDFCETTHCQRYDPANLTNHIQSLAQQTAGELLWYEGKPAFTPYTRDCGGRTEDAAAVWPDLAAPYLKAHDDRHSPYPWQYRADPAALAHALEKSLLRTPRRIERILIQQRTPSGRARTLLLYGPGGDAIPISASSFRFAMGRELGWNTVQSDRYEIRDGLTFDGNGSGHGVGLCQRGADSMGTSGRTYHEILAFYYPGTVPGLTGRGLSWRRLGGDTLTVLTTQPDQDHAIVALAERELQSAARRTQFTIPRDIEIRIYPDLDTYRNATGEPGWAAAHTSGHRISLQPAAVLRSRGVLDQTIRHELLHVLIESRAAPSLPTWFREGLVVYLAEPTAPAPGRPIPSDADLSQTADPAKARRAYADAASSVATLAKRYGETTVFVWLATGLPAEVRNASNSHDPTKSK